MTDTATTIINAIKQLRNLERYNRLNLSNETLKELDRWIRHWLFSDDLTDSEKKRLQDFYLQTL